VGRACCGRDACRWARARAAERRTPAAGATTTLVNIDPPPPTAGFVIVLNGASSSGKSSLARRVQALLDLPFLLISGDQLIEAGLLPARRDPQGPFDWLGQMRPRFFDGFHRCISALAAAGNNVLVCAGSQPDISNHVSQLLRQQLLDDAAWHRTGSSPVVQA